MSMFLQVLKTLYVYTCWKRIQTRFTKDFSTNVFGVVRESLTIAIDGCTEPLKSVGINSVQNFGLCIRRNVRDTAWK